MTLSTPSIDVVSFVTSDESLLKESISRVIGFVQAPDSSKVQFCRVSVRVVRDDEMSTLHAKYSGDPSTTDVIAFVGSLPSEPVELDVAVCRDEAQRQAAQLGHSLEHELLLYTVHAMVHASGFDDGSDSEAVEMRAQQDRILVAAGFPALSTRANA